MTVYQCRLFDLPDYERGLIEGALATNHLDPAKVTHIETGFAESDDELRRDVSGRFRRRVTACGDHFKIVLLGTRHGMDCTFTWEVDE